MRADVDLSELAQGGWEGRRREDIEADDGALLAAWRRDPLQANAPGGERVIDAAVRARAAVDRAVAGLAVAAAGSPTAPSSPGLPSSRSRPAVSGYPGPATPDAPWTLLVGHDGVFKLVLLTLLGLPLERFWTFPFALCGLTIVELRDGRGVLRAHNLVEHLAPLAEEPRAEAEAAEREASGAF